MISLASQLSGLGFARFACMITWLLFLSESDVEEVLWMLLDGTLLTWSLSIFKASRHGKRSGETLLLIQLRK